MADAAERRWTGASPARLFAACLRAVAERGWSISHTDAALRTVSFTTGISLRSWAGQEMTVVVEAVDDDTVRVLVGGKRVQRGNPFGGGGQIFDWGEKGKIIREFFETLERVLPGVDEPEAPTIAANAASSPTFELERLAELHERGALSDEEFRRAKARLLGG